jgi:hypothetical protein
MQSAVNVATIWSNYTTKEATDRCRKPDLGKGAPPPQHNPLSDDSNKSEPQHDRHNAALCHPHDALFAVKHRRKKRGVLVRGTREMRRHTTFWQHKLKLKCTWEEFSTFQSGLYKHRSDEYSGTHPHWTAPFYVAAEAETRQQLTDSIITNGGKRKPAVQCSFGYKYRPQFCTVRG